MEDDDFAGYKGREVYIGSWWDTYLVRCRRGAADTNNGRPGGPGHHSAGMSVHIFSGQNFSKESESALTEDGAKAAAAAGVVSISIISVLHQCTLGWAP